MSRSYHLDYRPEDMGSICFRTGALAAALKLFVSCGCWVLVYVQYIEGSVCSIETQSERYDMYDLRIRVIQRLITIILKLKGHADTKHTPVPISI